jgi:hypothetical protein
MRKICRRLMISAAAAGLLASVALWCVVAASRRAPEFYRQALAASPAALAQDGQRFEHDALDLHNQLQEEGHWQALLTQDEINGWLATDLPAKFPKLLPPGVSQPRLAIEDGKFRVAVHYQRGRVDTVLSLTGEAYLTAQPNEVAVRLDAARAGLVPVPLARFIDEISAHAARADLPLRWSEVRGAPVALLRVPLNLNDDGKRQVLLDRVELQDATLLLAGRTQKGPRDGDRAAPVTAGQPGEKETRQR